MKKDKRVTYEAPHTERIQVSLESGVCAASKEKVVVDDDNTSVSIERQGGEGSDFVIDSWDDSSNGF